MRKLIAGAVISIAALGSSLAVADPGPHHGHNAFGLCTAYAHNGGGNSHDAPPFQALEDEAEAAGQTVAEWCADNAPHPGNRP